MKKVYQTDTTSKSGNCMQAVIASLINKPLYAVPNFMLIEGKWFENINNYLKEQGYKVEGFLHNEKYQKLCHPTLDCFDGITFGKSELLNYNNIKHFTGIDGYFFASVLSPKYTKSNAIGDNTHAVIVDHAFNIVHDPNRNYSDIIRYPLADVIGFNGIIDVMKINKI